MSKPKIAVLTGAGMSAESGISTFRDNGGLWDQYRIEDVATPEAFERQPETVLEFYNQRRRKLAEVEPNSGHKALAALEANYDVRIVTQNIDDLHERAGSTQVYHLHGELKKAKSSIDDSLIYDIGFKDIYIDDKCEKGSQLRPHVVWFGEPVPMIEVGMRLFMEADIVLIIGTSLEVYPAAGLINYAGTDAPKYYIDPQASSTLGNSNMEIIKAKATEGVPKIADRLMMNS